jgi:hypothetical protein
MAKTLTKMNSAKSNKHANLWTAIWLMLSLMLLTLSTVPVAKAKTKVSHETALLMSLSSLDRQMEALPGVLINALKASGKQTVDVPASLISTLTEAVQVSFVADELRDKLKHHVHENLTTEEIKALLKWYDSDLGSRIIQLEAEAVTQEGLQKMVLGAGQLLADQRVLPYADRIDQIISATDFTIKLQNMTQRAIFQASTIGLTPGAPLDTSQFDQQWTAQASQIQAATKQMTRLTYSYTYQNLSNQELEAYADFLSSPAALKFNDITQKGIEDLFKDATERMVKYVSNKPERNPLSF